MCIICAMEVTADLKDINTAEDFLSAFLRARVNMQESARLMKLCSKVAIRPETRKQYDKTHKKMVRLIREWNKLEQFREAHQPHLDAAPALSAPEKALEHHQQ